jgi:hypothetical protein
VELDAGVELDATEWRGSRRCETRRRHRPRQETRQADGAWPQREARVWAGAAQRRVRPVPRAEAHSGAARGG